METPFKLTFSPQVEALKILGNNQDIIDFALPFKNTSALNSLYDLKEFLNFQEFDCNLLNTNIEPTDCPSCIEAVQILEPLCSGETNEKSYDEL